MEELYKKTLDRLKAELKKQLPEIEANGDWLWHHPEAGLRTEPRNTVWRF